MHQPTTSRGDGHRTTTTDDRSARNTTSVRQSVDPFIQPSTDASGPATTALNGNPPADELPQTEQIALHKLELSIERLHRAHGHLLAFHHNIGRAMNHMHDAEMGFRMSDHQDVADALRDEYLPRGVLRTPGSPDPVDGRWSYAVIEEFQHVFLDDIVGFGDEVHHRLADGQRHINERVQERAWKARAGR